MSEPQGEYNIPLDPDERERSLEILETVTKEWNGVDESEGEGEEPEGDSLEQGDEPDEGQELETPVEGDSE